MSNFFYGRPIFINEDDPFYNGSYGQRVFADKADPWAETSLIGEALLSDETEKFVEAFYEF